MLKVLSRSAVAIGIAAAFALAPGIAHANSLTYGMTTFGGNNAAVDQNNGLAWVSPNIANGQTYDDLQALCPGGACTGALAGLIWASNAQVDQFWNDIGIPLNTLVGLPYPSFLQTQSYSAVGENLLGSLISFLGPTNIVSGYTLGTGGTTNYLGGLTNDPQVSFGALGSVPNTAYMFHESDVKVLGVGGYPDNETAITFGAGNGYAELPATKGWFYFTPQTMSVPEPGSLGSLGLGLALLSFGFAWDKRWRNKRIKGTEEMPMGRGAIA